MNESIIFHQCVQPDYWTVQTFIPDHYDQPTGPGSWHSVHHVSHRDLDFIKLKLAQLQLENPNKLYRIAAVATLIQPY